MKINGFTLAEVLITLAVIGVVAALTLPAVNRGSTDKATVEKVKKIYAQLNEALRIDMAENGKVTQWEVKGHGRTADTMAGHFTRSLKVVKDCGFVNTGADTPDSKVCFSKTAKTLAGKNTAYVRSYASHDVLLTNGIAVRFAPINTLGCNANRATYNAENMCGLIYVDLNAADSPNTLGRDIFAFILKKDTIVPVTKDDCKLSDIGLGCANYILENEKIDYPD